jgi:hypothetical protein
MIRTERIDGKAWLPFGSIEVAQLPDFRYQVARTLFQVKVTFAIPTITWQVSCFENYARREENLPGRSLGDGQYVEAIPEGC